MERQKEAVHVDAPATAADHATPSNSGKSGNAGSEVDNALNWPTWRKVLVVGIVSALGFSTPFAADVMAPSIPSIVKSLNSDSEAIKGFIVSIYNLGNAFGPVVFAPASELWGRSIVFHVSNVLFLAFTVACAVANSISALLVFRFLAGFAGAAPLVVGSGTIGDMITREQRGRYFAVFATGAQLAPLIGPAIGGTMSQRLSWRWSFWLVACIHGVITVAAFVFLRETYAPKILKDKRRHLKVEQPITRRRDYFTAALTRPISVLLTNPMVLFLSCYQALVWGYRFLMYTTLPQVFGDHYHFESTATGLTYLGNGLGATAALYSITHFSDKLVVRYKARHSGTEPPSEIRLKPLLWAGPLVPAGLLWYGWSAQAQVHWIVPVLGTVWFAAGIVAASLPANLYVVDAYSQHAASAMAGSLVLRSLVGGVLPIAGNPMFVNMGVGWGCTLLGLVALVMCVLSIGVVWIRTRAKQRMDLASLVQA